MKRFQYIHLHTPTGKRFRNEGTFESEQDFLRFLNKWNGMGGGVHVYTSADPIQPLGPHTVLNHSVRIDDQHVKEVDQLVKTGVWSSDGPDQPDLDELMGDEPQSGC